MNALIEPDTHIITRIATTMAATMTGSSLTSPTAVNTESSENTISTSPICTITATSWPRSEEHTSELQSQSNLVCRLLLETKKTLRFSTLRVLTASTSESFRTTIFLLTPLGVCCRRLCGQGSLHFYCRLMLHLMGVQTSPY